MSNPFVGFYEGCGQQLQAGENISAGDLVAIKDADGEVYKAKADDATLRPAIGIAETTVVDDEYVEIKQLGRVTNESGLSEGKPVYLSETAGDVTQTPKGEYAQVVGVAITTTDYILNIQPPCAIVTLQATEAGNLTSSSTGNYLWTAPVAGMVVDVGIRVGTTGSDSTEDLEVEGDINIDGTTCMTTLPKITKAASNGADTFTAGTGVTQGVVNAAANTFDRGDALTFDLDLERTASPSIEIADITIIALVALGAE